MKVWLRRHWRRIDQVIMLLGGGMIIVTSIVVLPFTNPFLNAGLVITGLYVCLMPHLEAP